MRISDWSSGVCSSDLLPTLAGLRRRGYTPSAIRLFCERLGVSKADSRIDYSILEQALRDDLDPKAERLVAVLDPIKLLIVNYPEGQRSEEHTSELQSLMRISYAVFCLKKKKIKQDKHIT